MRWGIYFVGFKEILEWYMWFNWVILDWNFDENGI